MMWFARRQLPEARIAITGASAGIGLALADELARRGAKLLLNARRDEALREIASGLTAHGGEVEFVAGDITDAAVRAAIINRATTQLGGLDILVNNAGIGGFGRFDEATPDRLRRIMEVNFFAAVELTRSVLPLLRQSARDGVRPLVVNVGSILGHRGIPLAAEYCASKFALRGFTESLRSEVVGQGIDVLLVSPGTTETGFHDAAMESQTKPSWRKEGSGVTSQYVARQIATAMERGRREIVPSLSGKLLLLANRFFPGLVDRVMRRYSQ